MENKSIKSFVGLIIVLIVLVVFLIGLVIYKEFIVDYDLDNNVSESNSRSTSIKNTEIKEKISKKDLEAYLSYVPLSYIYNNDAYSGNRITLDNINKSILMEQVYYKTNKGTGKIQIEDEMCGDTLICETDDYVLLQDFEKVAKYMYNYSDLDISEFKIAGGSVKRVDNYFGALYGMGAVSLEKASLIEEYEIINDELIIYEKSGIIENNLGEVNVYKYHGYNTYYKTVNTVTMTEEEYDITINNLKTEIVNSDEFPIYKHTFKKNGNGSYYWYSTEIKENK